MKYYLNNKLKVSKIRVQCSGSIRFDYFLASSILSPGTTGANRRGIEITEIQIKGSALQNQSSQVVKDITKPAAYMLSDWKTQYRSRCWEHKLELGDIMTELPLLYKFKLPEVFGVQATYRRPNHSQPITNELQLQAKLGPGSEPVVLKKDSAEQLLDGTKSEITLWIVAGAARFRLLKA